MLGFGKKKKKDANDAESSKKDADPKKDALKKPEKKKGKGDPDSEKPPEGRKPEKKKRKWLSKKLILIALMVLIAIGASAYVVVHFYFSPKTPDAQVPVYQKIELAHVKLPEEMLRFSFDYLPALYPLLIAYNTQIQTMDMEIARIEAIAQKYPDQAKIAEKEKAVWEKTKATLEKSFLKIEKPVKEIYVLFRVNKEQGLAEIDARHKELTELAQASLTPVQELTQKIKTTETIPTGLIDGTWYKLKKKFL
jgi:hypothetical protein